MKQELTADHRAHQALAEAITADDHHLVPINAGQGVAMLRTIRTAAEVIVQRCTDAARLLDRRGTSWGARRVNGLRPLPKPI